ncbi:restriction endonuclease subunit S [Streptomyces sp. T028]|uniref:restriction endonuclease subunit S n=1 Tax=Streptomyces sp. T028 TaxID=3394379 RepID=UPI003A86E621
MDGERELPAGWAWAALGDVADTALGKMLDKKQSTGLHPTPYLRNVNVQWGQIDTDDLLTMDIEPDDLSRFMVSKDDLVVCEGGEVGRCAIWHKDEPIAFQKALHRVRPSRALDNRYLRYYLEYAASAGKLAKLSTGSTIKHLPQQRLREVPVPLPPLAEQHRIVEALEEQLPRLDAAEATVKRVRHRKPHLSGAFRDALIHANGDLPTGWRWGELDDVIERVEAGKSFRCDPRPALDEEWGVIKVSAMTWGEFRQEEQKAVPVGREIDARHEIRVGDILVSRANTPEYVGAPVLVRQTRTRLLLSDKSLRLVPKSGVNRNWLITVLSAPLVRRQITARATGSKDSMRNISQKDLLSVKVPVPPEDEQQSLAERADELLTALDGAAREVERVAARAGALRRALLRRAFSGQLVSQDPADEDASAVLAHVAAERAAQPRATRPRRSTGKKAAVPRVAMPAAPEPTPAPALAVQQEFDL